jgi:iron(III) transport system substrate-binding protein
MSSRSVGRQSLSMLIVLAATLLAGWTLLKKPEPNALVVYCAHDLVYSEAVLQEFERKTGIRCVIVADTEATKSLGLVERILREGQGRQCDVFWNNEILGTIQLQKAGRLESYTGSGYGRIPPTFRDPDGQWAGFGARMRVWIVNTNKMEATQEAIDKRLEEADLSKMAIAKPLFGTTLTQYCLEWQNLGEETLKARHADWIKRGCNVVSGNATVKDLVASGTCDFGLTDTDDYFVAADEKRPVAMLPYQVQGKTISIPNTVALIRGSKKPEQARKLIDFLLSEATEIRLAHSGSRQIPLGPVKPEKLHEDVRQLAAAAKNSSDIAAAASVRDACLAWLKQEYTQ